MCDVSEISAEFRAIAAQFGVDNGSTLISVDCAILDRVETPRGLLSWLWVGVLLLLLVVGVVGCCTTALRICYGVAHSHLSMNGTMVGSFGAAFHHAQIHKTIVPLQVYVTALCAIDLASTLSIGPLIVHELWRVWPLGALLCRLDVVLEWTGKIFNTYMLLAVSFERYVAVCRPYHRVLLGRRFGVAATAVLLFVGGVQMLPIFFGSSVTLVNHQLDIEPMVAQYSAHPSQPYLVATVFVTRQCEFDETGFGMEAYLLWLCATSFAVPLLLNVAFSLATFSALQRRHRHRLALNNAANNERRLIRNGWSSLLLTIFYTVCFLPHWVSTVGVIVLQSASDVTHTDPVKPTSPWLATALYMLQLLPHVNSSFNWILYGAMNRQLNAAAPYRTTLLGVGNAHQQHVASAAAVDVGREAKANRRRWRYRQAGSYGMRNVVEFSVGISMVTTGNSESAGGRQTVTPLHSQISQPGLSMETQAL